VQPNSVGGSDCSRTQLLDLAAVWDAADDDQRSRLRGFFQSLVLELLTSRS